MPKSPHKLSDVLTTSPVPEGFNDGRWFLLEHQLYQSRLSIQQVRELALQIAKCPENPKESELALAILEAIRLPYIASSETLADVKRLLAGTEVAERIGDHET